MTQPHYTIYYTVLLFIMKHKQYEPELGPKKSKIAVTYLKSLTFGIDPTFLHTTHRKVGKVIRCMIINKA